jgi:VIT1/CCC1 family predicted Fe2+/Mn2+ transporter/rubrerythrin
VTGTAHARSAKNLELERDAIALYEGLARIERDRHRAAAFLMIARNERRHAEIWARKLRESGVELPEPKRPSPRIRFILLVARVFGTRAVADLVRALEGREEETYASQSSPEVAAIAADEREHADIWRRLETSPPGRAVIETDGPSSRGEEAARSAQRALAGGAHGIPSGTIAGAMPRGTTTAAGLAARPEERVGRERDEAWHHRAGRTGTLRAAIFGVNDGLVSNLALVMGVTGASANNDVVVLTGVAGLLAGAFSMGAGEWISMQSQRELFERQIALEREELAVMPEEEEEELAQIYRRKGLPERDARRLADRLMEDPEIALDTKVREELGLDPDQLGSPWGAAAGSFVSFAAGAVVPLAPFLLAAGPPAVGAALVLAFGALFAVGAGVSLLTGRGALFSGVRQVAIGAAAAAVTFSVGAAIGVQVRG